MHWDSSCGDDKIFHVGFLQAWAATTGTAVNLPAVRHSLSEGMAVRGSGNSSLKVTVNLRDVLDRRLVVLVLDHE